MLFCQEDRAILCRDCDSPIHNANDLTKKHSRFLLTGIKISPSATPDSPGSVAASSTSSEVAEEPPGDVTEVNHRSHLLGVDAAAAAKQQKKPAAAPVAAEVSGGATAATAASFGNGSKVMAQDKAPFNGISGVASSVAANAGGSSISEYLIKELPGWHVEDLLLDAFPAVHPAAFTFSKVLTLPLPDPPSHFLVNCLRFVGYSPGPRAFCR